MAKLDADKVKRDARGKWPSILQTLGVDKAYLLNRHGPCPICQDGKDRYRFDDKGDGRWFCQQCPKQGGDGFSLLMGVRGWKFPEALEEVAKIVGTAVPVKIRQGPSEEEVKREANAIWGRAVQLKDVPDVEDWWRARVGRVPVLCDVRATPSLRFPAGGAYAAQLALVRGVDGAPVNIHRTWLGRGGQKANVDEPRRVMALSMPKGSAVRLFPYQGVLGIAEGIETAVAASLLFEVPVWAAINSTLLEGWEPPEGVRVIVFGDNDRKFGGQAAAYRLGYRLSARKVDVEVRLPPTAGLDWNDVWQARTQSNIIDAVRAA